MQAIADSLQSYSPIGLKQQVNTNNPIDYRINTNSDVDALLQDCSDIIDARYTPWFAKRFYCIPRDRILTLASQARQDAKVSSQQLFSHLVRKEDQSVRKITVAKA